MKIEQMHHVAYRCKDAKETVEWYGKMLKMDFILAIAEDHVPSTHEPDPYMHVSSWMREKAMCLRSSNCRQNRTWDLTPTRRAGCSISLSR